MSPAIKKPASSKKTAPSSVYRKQSRAKTPASLFSIQPFSPTDKPFLSFDTFDDPDARRVISFNYNSLRPNVKASNRILYWTSSAYIKKYHAQNNGGGLSSKDVESFESVMAHSLEEATRANYGAGLLRFHQFCDDKGVSEDDRVPASVDLIGTWLAQMGASKVSHKTMNNWIAGLRAWHLKERAIWYGDCPQIKMLLRGALKVTPTSSNRPPRSPVTISHMKALHENLDFQNSFDVAVWAAASVAFWGCCRLGELTIPSLNKYEPSRHVSNSGTVELKSCSRNENVFATIKIPWTKTTLTAGSTIVLTQMPENDPYCAVQALTNHILANSHHIPHTAPLFSFLDSSDVNGWKPMTKIFLMTRCNNIWRKEGLVELTGHSYRIGGATEYLLQGVSPDIVKRIGRWESDAFQVYWRKLEEIIPTFLNLKNSDSRYDSMLVSLRSSFSKS